MTAAAERALLRHTLATLAYRARKALRDAPPEFATFRISDGTREPAKILAHMGDLMDWGLALARGEKRWNDSTPLAWNDEVERFFTALAAFDDCIASDAPLAVPAGALFQGPVADALTHVGQIALLRRMAGAPVRGENYFRAEIVAGRIGTEQTPPRREFD
jgi:hypothetical protein